MVGKKSPPSAGVFIGMLHTRSFYRVFRVGAAKLSRRLGGLLCSGRAFKRVFCGRLNPSGKTGRKRTLHRANRRLQPPCRFAPVACDSAGTIARAALATYRLAPVGQKPRHHFVAIGAVWASKTAQAVD